MGKGLDFENIIYHSIRAILTETICSFGQIHENYKLNCGLNCFPCSLAKNILNDLGFKANHEFYQEYD